MVNQEYLGKLRAPTLWRGGVQVIRAAGHVPQWEQPTQFGRLLEDFIEDCERWQSAAGA